MSLPTNFQSFSIFIVGLGTLLISRCTSKFFLEREGSRRDSFKAYGENINVVIFLEYTGTVRRQPVEEFVMGRKNSFLLNL